MIQENANKSTPEYLDEINWINKEVCKNKDEIYCTAGLDYFIINLDGEIFKCYGYYPDPKYRICTIKDPQFFINYKGSPKCECMNCNEYCEDYKVEVWKNNEKIWDALYWRERINSIDDINLNNLFLQIDLVRGCFNNCPYCFVGKQNHTSFINTDNILNFVDTIAPYKKGKKFINISGSGESLLHPDFEKIINNFTNNGFYCEIITSGLIFPEKLMKLENKQLIYLIISYHPCSKNWNFNKIEKLLSMVCNSNFYKVGSSLVRYKGNLKFRNDLLELNKKFNININEPTYRS
ncbi:MAG: radical SAM protein [Bacillota bacterium]